MSTVRYTVLDGEVKTEKRSGVTRSYLPDPIGSTLAMVDGMQNVTDTFRYWPYGETQARTGSTATPFQFVGTAGYYRDTANRTYVRARHLDTAKGRWISKDPVGFDGHDINLYRYAANRPVDIVDPSGLDFQWPIYGNYCGPGWPNPKQQPPPNPIDALDRCCQAHDKTYAQNGYSVATWAACMAARRLGGTFVRLGALFCKACRDIVDADHVLCNCALNAKCFQKGDSSSSNCVSRRAAIIAYMCTS